MFVCICMEILKKTMQFIMKVDTEKLDGRRK